MATLTIYENGSKSSKTLDPSIATSILCHSGILHSAKEFVYLGSNKENEIFRVKHTNICIMHVECSFCILVDYIVDGIYIPGKILEQHYGVYQSKCCRDWIKNTRSRELIGYELKEFANKGTKCSGQELDHMAETFNELDKSKRFIPKELNAGASHRSRICINSNADLAWLIDKIKYIDNQVGGTFLM